MENAAKAISRNKDKTSIPLYLPNHWKRRFASDEGLRAVVCNETNGIGATYLWPRPKYASRSSDR
jgi:hypothetical protein